MGKIVIKKRVSLEFLGDEYKDCYVVLRKMPISQFEEFHAELEKIDGDTVKTTKYVVKLVQDNFVEGKFVDDRGELIDIAAEDLGEFDQETMTTLFEMYTGQQTDPKDLNS